MSMVKREFVFEQVYQKDEDGNTEQLGVMRIELLNGFKDQGKLIDGKSVEKQDKKWVYIKR